MPLHHSHTRHGLMGLEPLQTALISRSDLLRNVLALSAAAASVRTGAAIAQIDQPRMPALTGPYADIGCRYTRVRGARCKLFYPASGPSSVEAPYCTVLPRSSRTLG